MYFSPEGRNAFAMKENDDDTKSSASNFSVFKRLEIVWTPVIFPTSSRTISLFHTDKLAVLSIFVASNGVPSSEE